MKGVCDISGCIVKASQLTERWWNEVTQRYCGKPLGLGSATATQLPPEWDANTGHRADSVPWCILMSGLGIPVAHALGNTNDRTHGAESIVKAVLKVNVFFLIPCNLPVVLWTFSCSQWLAWKSPEKSSFGFPPHRPRESTSSTNTLWWPFSNRLCAIQALRYTA